MRYFLCCILIHCFLGTTNAQEWHTIDYHQYGFTSGGWYQPTTGAERGFGINPYDNTIWMMSTYHITYIDNHGHLNRFHYQTHPVLNGAPSREYRDLAFANGKVYALDRWSGLYSYDGTDWNLDHQHFYGIELFVDNDTIWIGESEVGATTAKVYNSILTFLDFSANRVRSKNGNVWFHRSSYIYSYESGQFGDAHSPDTSLVLGLPVSTFKFSSNTDSLYVATAEGISIAHDDIFIDTITANNTTNMPSGKITEIEFDKDDNIWAIFSELDNSPHTSLAFLDRSINSWTQVYDESNSPISFAPRNSIELDTLGNLWFVENKKLHCLKLGNEVPQWLGEKELEQFNFSVYPNPGNEDFTISLDKVHHGISLEVYDLVGKVILQKEYDSTDAIDLSIENGTGVYLVQLTTDDGYSKSVRVINQ